MEIGSAKYTEEEKRAVVLARERFSAPVVARMAAEGTLVDRHGTKLEPFKIPASSVRDYVRQARGDRVERLSERQKAEPRDAVEQSRLDLVALVEEDAKRLKRRHRADKAAVVGGEALRQHARAIRELAAIPGLSDPRPLKPGGKVDGVSVGDRTRGGLAGQVLAASRGTGAPAVEPEPVPELPIEPEPGEDPLLTRMRQQLIDRGEYER